MKPKWQRLGLLLILVGYLGLAQLYNVLLPLWETPDEPGHVEFIRYVEQHGSLPTQRPPDLASTPTSPPGNEFVQVPSYYLLLSPLLDWIWVPPGAEWHRNPYVTWPDQPSQYALALHRADEAWPWHGLALLVHLGRFISSLFGVAVLVATYRLIVDLTGRHAAALFGTAWLAGSPAFLLAGSRLSNDSYAAAWSALALLLCARIVIASRPPGATGLIHLSLTVAATLFAKLNTAFVAPLVVFALVVSEKRENAPGFARVWRGLLRSGPVLVLPLGLVGGWWLIVGRQFGDYVGTQGGFGAANPLDVLAYVNVSSILAALHTINLTWWGLAQFEAQIVWPGVVYVALGSSTVALIAVGLIALWRGAFDGVEAQQARLATVLLSLSTLPLLYLTIARQIVPSIGYVAQSRFLLPAAPVAALLVALGWNCLARARYPRAVALTYLAGVVAVGIAAPLVLFPQIRPPSIPARLARDPSELSQVALASYSNGVDLVGIDGLPSTIRPGEALPLHLRWRVAASLGEDFTVSVKLLKLTGERVTGTDVSPYTGIFPPRLWQRGEFVDTDVPVQVPVQLTPGAYSLSVELYQWRNSEPVAIPLTSAAGSFGAYVAGSWRVLPDPAALPGARASNARFGDALVLTSYNVEQAPATLRVSLIWQARHPLARHLVVSVQLLDAAGHLVAQHDGEPVGGELPTTLWSPGASVRDNHDIALAVVPAASRVILAVYDRDTLQRLPVLTEGHPASDHLDLSSK